jgi:hypothetical protein
MVPDTISIRDKAVSAPDAKQATSEMLSVTVEKLLSDTSGETSNMLVNRSTAMEAPATRNATLSLARSCAGDHEREARSPRRRANIHTEQLRE